MKKWRAVLLFCCITAMLCACGKKTDVDQNTVIIDKKGHVTEAIVEDFNQPYYDVDELKNEIADKILQYNTNAGTEDAVTLDLLEKSDDNIMNVNITFSSYKDYVGFNEKELFCGTVSQAYAQGYEFPSMKDVSQEGKTITGTDVLEKGEMHMVVLEEAQQVITPSKIVYVSEDVSVLDNKVAVNQNEGTKAFIIYE